MDKTDEYTMLTNEKGQNSDLATLYKKTFHAGTLVFLIGFLEKALVLIRTIILARLLLPEHFGLIGISWLFISTIEIFSYTGLVQALIQKKGSNWKR